MSIYSQKHHLNTFNNPDSTLFKIFNLVPKNSQKILDVGCSSGYLGRYIKQNFESSTIVDGIEIDQHDRKIADKYLDNTYEINIQNLKKIKKLNKKYNTIIFADVLEHTTLPNEILKEFTKKLLPNGHIVISIPNIVHQSTLIELISGQWNYEESGILDKTHLHFFDYNGIINLIEGNGLYIEKIDFSVVDIPDQKIFDDLSKMDIKDKEKKLLIKILNRPQHKIFQYIILATNKKPQKYQSFLKKQTIFKPVKDWINYWEQTLEKYQNTEKISNELNEIKNSKLFKLWPTYNKIKYAYQKIRNIF